MRTFTFLVALLAAFSVNAQNDDIYYSPRNDSSVTEQPKPEPKIKQEAKHDARQYDNDDENNYSDYDEGTYSDSQTQNDGSGNTYITNNYYGDYYGNDYTTRMRRFYSPYMGFSYYSPCYIGYDYYDPFSYSPGWSWSVSIGGGWGYPSIWGYYDPWYTSYNPWYDPWY